MTKRAIFMVVSLIARNLEKEYRELMLALLASGTSSYIIKECLQPIGEQIVYLLALEEKMRKEV